MAAVSVPAAINAASVSGLIVVTVGVRSGTGRGCCNPGRTAGDGGTHGIGTVVFDQTTCQCGVEQAIVHLGFGQCAAADELVQGKGRAVGTGIRRGE